MSTRPAASRSLPAPSKRLDQIDALKGLAMIAVIFLHAMPAHELFDSAALFWIGQAVPIFVVIMGLNGALSLTRSGAVSLRELYPPGYARSRLDRLWLPFAILFGAAMVVAVARGVASPRQLSGLISGVLPVAGPGNYFVGFAFQFAVVFPLVFACFRRSVLWSALAAFAINVGFELISPHVGRFGSDPFFYVSSFLHWLPFVAVGCVLAHLMTTERAVPAWWWALGVLSALHLVVVSADASLLPWSIPGWREWGQTFAGAPYAGLLVAAGLLWLPARAHAGFRPVAIIGRRSYEIFLFQILWFALVPERSLLMIGPDLIVCLLLGCLASIALDRGRAARRRHRRPAPAAA